MSNPFDNAGVFLIQTIFDIYILVLMLRVLLHWVDADYYNPISQFVIKLTKLPLTPFQRVIPSFRGIDMAAFVFALVLEMLKIVLIVWINSDTFPRVGGLTLWALGDLENTVIDIYFYAIIIEVVMSWVNPQGGSPIVAVLYKLTEPLMRPVRKIIPPIGGIDITPIPVLILLKLVTIVLANPLIQMGMMYAIGNTSA